MGLHHPTTGSTLIPPNRWTNVKGWQLNAGNCGDSKVCFNEDIKVLRDDSSFVAPRSGLYYVSLYLESDRPKGGQYFVNVTVVKNNNGKSRNDGDNTGENNDDGSRNNAAAGSENVHYVTKFDCVKNRRHIRLDEVVLIDKDDALTVFLWSTESVVLTSRSRVSLQFLNSYQNIVGFVAYPTVGRAVSNTDPQVSRVVIKGVGIFCPGTHLEQKVSPKF